LYNIVSGENHGDNLNSRNEVLLAAAEKIMVKAGGRPHIGKMMRSPEILSNFSEEGLAKFLEIREAEDPDRLFLSEYLQNIFSL
jgi:FAD/FMN-containing dehydrogenase